MDKERVCEQVRKICEDVNIDFLFITEEKSCWSISKESKHLRDVVNFHKENESK